MRKINEEFVCLNCRQPNIPARKTCRNHCVKCLCSLHVDNKTPGDRQSGCHGLMIPISIEKSGKKGIIITHKCATCRKIQNNKAADDDNMDKIIEVSTYGVSEK